MARYTPGLPPAHCPLPTAVRYNPVMPGPEPQFSMYVFTVLLLVVGASVVMFWWLAVRWTVRRHWAATAEWARTQGMTLRSVDYDARESIDLPEVLADVQKLNPDVRAMLQDERRTLLRFITPTTPHSQQIHSPSTWHVLLLKLEVTWPATALRPAANHVSLVDLLPLTSFPSLTSNERFVVFGTDTRSARQIANSSALTLLPADVGLLLIGPFLILDFSTRPFDTIEFGRALALAEQIVSFLPTATV